LSAAGLRLDEDDAQSELQALRRRRVALDWITATFRINGSLSAAGHNAKALSVGGAQGWRRDAQVSYSHQGRNSHSMNAVGESRDSRVVPQITTLKMAGSAPCTGEHSDNHRVVVLLYNKEIRLRHSPWTARLDRRAARLSAGGGSGKTCSRFGRLDLEQAAACCPCVNPSAPTRHEAISDDGEPGAARLVLLGSLQSTRPAACGTGVPTVRFACSFWKRSHATFVGQA
jgi:hypothetical protein